jgi:hypothetical protein
MNDGVRLRELPDVDCKSDRSGIVSRGGTKVVKAEPVPDETVEDWTLLVIDPMVLMEPVGDPEVDLSGIVTE